MKVAALQANATNNTLFADDKGEIAFLHAPVHAPRATTASTIAAPVDGADPATDWKGLHALDELPHVVNPPSGWVYNTNDGPWFGGRAGQPASAADFPRYMDTVGAEPARRARPAPAAGQHGLTLERLRAAAFDPALPAFDDLISAAARRLRRACPPATR